LLYSTTIGGGDSETCVMLQRIAAVALCAGAATFVGLGPPMTQPAAAQFCNNRCNGICAAKPPRAFGGCMDKCLPKCAASFGGKSGGTMKAGAGKKGARS